MSAVPGSEGRIMNDVSFRIDWNSPAEHYWHDNALETDVAVCRRCQAGYMHMVRWRGDFWCWTCFREAYRP